MGIIWEKSGWRSSLLVMAAVLLLAGCSTMGTSDPAISIASARGGKISLLPQTRNPVLVVESKTGIGRARLQLKHALPEGMIVEFPGLRQLELFSLKKGGKALVCHGTAELEVPCSWGNEWPLASVKRYPRGMTVIIPAVVLAEPGEWSLEWVDYYRK